MWKCNYLNACLSHNIIIVHLFGYYSVDYCWARTVVFYSSVHPSRPSSSVVSFLCRFIMPIPRWGYFRSTIRKIIITTVAAAAEPNQTGRQAQTEDRQTDRQSTVIQWSSSGGGGDDRKGGHTFIAYPSSIEHSPTMFCSRNERQR